MRNFNTEFKVGLFVVVSLAVLVYMFLKISPRFDALRYTNYYTNLNNAAGIIPKSQVRTNGVLVGQVDSVNLDSIGTKIVVLVNQDIKLPLGSTIEVRSRGLLGDVYLEIVRAPDNGEYIPSGGLIPNKASGMDMDSLVKMFGSIGEDIKKITSALANSTSNNGENSLKNILTNLDQASESIKDILAENRRSLHSLIDNLNTTVAAVKDGVVDEKGNRFARIMANADQSLEDIRKSAESIAMITKKIENGEGTLGKLINDESTIEKIDAALTEVSNFISPMSKLSVGVDWHAEAGTSSDENVRNYLNIKLQTRPDKYYLLGVADVGADDNLRQTRLVKTTVDGDTTTEAINQSSKEQKALKFNLQFAKRWGFATMRVGLFESKGGFGTDLHALNDRIKWTFEMFDFDKENKEIRKVSQVKTYVSMSFFKHIYALAGINDITSLKPNGKIDTDFNYFFGAGLQFTDNDLKALVGSAVSSFK